MLVKSGDYLCRKNKWYGVVCADKFCFVIGRLTYNKKEKCRHINYKKLEAYSNDENVNTLEELNFYKEIK